MTWARPCFPAPSSDDAEVLDAVGPPRAVVDTLSADGAGLGSRQAVTQGERCPPPWDLTEKGPNVDYLLRRWIAGKA